MSGFQPMPSMGPMDPLSRRRADEAAMKIHDNREASEREKLNVMAAFLPVVESEAAGKLMDLVEKVLIERIGVFLQTDPEAQAMIKILNAFHDERNIALRAVMTLTKKDKK